MEALQPVPHVNKNQYSVNNEEQVVGCGVGGGVGEGWGRARLWEGVENRKTDVSKTILVVAVLFIRRVFKVTRFVLEGARMRGDALC